MITEDQVLALFAEDNPVPNPEDLDLTLVDARLATLEQRSSEMMEMDTKETKEQKKGPRTTWLAAAAAVIVIGVVAIVMNQSPEESDVANPTTEATAVVPTTEPSAETGDAWEQIPLLVNVASGQMRLPDFEPELAFAGADDWNLQTRGPDWAILLPPGATLHDGGDGRVYFLRVSDTSVEEQVQRLQNPDVFTTPPPEQVDVDGVPGVRLTPTPLEATTLANFPEGAETGSPSVPGWADEEFIVYFLEVGGETVMVVAIGPDRATVDDIVESIVWRDLP